MKKLLLFIKSLLVLGLICALFYNNQIVAKYDIWFWSIPTVSFLSVFLIIYKYIHLSLQIRKNESDFTTIVNHTFRTPLTRIMWLSNELKNDLSPTEKLANIKDIENATDRLLNIVDTFLGIKDVNNISSYVFGAVSLREIVETSLLKHSSMIDQKHIKLSVSIFNKMPLLTADLKKISFVIDALIENAIIYTPVGGTILIDCQVINNKIVFYVADSGIGLNSFEKLSIFSKFYRGKRAILTNPDGMGLGLYLSKIIINRHNGKMYAKSSGVNKGTTFFIELPLNS